LIDIVELVLSDHERILRLQTALHDVARYHHDGGSRWALASTWDRLASLIELHIEAQGEICYPAIFEASPAGQAQMQQSLADHDDICEAIGESRLQPVGSPGWWRAVTAALSTWFEQTDREEREALARFARRAGRAQRDKLGRQWSAFIAARLNDLMRHKHPGGAVCEACRWPIPATHPHTPGNYVIVSTVRRSQIRAAQSAGGNGRGTLP
jgi:hypothetical protein